MSANIEDLVKKHSRAFSGDVRGLRNALTEQAEAFKGELQAYDGMVRELTKTVEDMQAAQAVPEHIRSIKIPTDAMEQEFQTHYRRGFEAGKKSVQPVAVVGDVVAWLQYRDHSGMRPTTIHLCDSDSKGAFEVIRKPAHSITSTELATLREKAAHFDFIEVTPANQLESVLYDTLLERDELRKALQIAFQHIDKDTHGNDHAMVYAAIAQGKGE